MRLFKYFIFSIFFSFGVLSATAQINAVTDEGEQVILYEDGTWVFLNREPEADKEIPVNSKKFKKPEDAGFLVKSSVCDIGVWINPKKWSFNRALEGDAAEYNFELKSGDLYGMLISEQIEIPLMSLRNIAIDNARAASPDLKVVHEEMRNVNGNDVLVLRMDGSISGIKFSYYGYYYTDESGTIQFLTYTSQNLLEEYQDSIESLLNGLVRLSGSTKNKKR